ncbi:MAG: Gfo/Idh/MocA family oxidoreductase [Bacillota bacterium]
MKKIRVGIVGSGFMASVHCKNLYAMSNVEIVALCHPFVKPEKLIDEYKIGGYFKDFKAMIDESNLDAIIIAIPPFAHGGEVEYAAEKGVNVFMEKPIALTHESAQSMADAVAKSGIKSMVGYMMRYGAAVTKLKEMIDNGTAGVVTLMDARYECNSLHTPWWRVKEKSGGQVLEQIIHLYDLSMFFAGKPKSAVGFTANLTHQAVDGYNIEDTSSGLINFECGAIASISGTNNAVQWQWNNPFTVVCQNVTVRFKDANSAEFVFTGEENPVSEQVDGTNDMYLEEMRAFIDLLSGKDVTVPTIQDGLESLNLVDAVSNSNGKQIIF